MLVTVDASALKLGLVERLVGDLMRGAPPSPAVRAVGNALAVALWCSRGVGGPTTVDLDFAGLSDEELAGLCARWRAMAEAFGDSPWPEASAIAANLYRAADHARVRRSVL